ncbi:hypothetical protein AcidC75_06010 [Acidisoma sp. C75]
MRDAAAHLAGAYDAEALDIPAVRHVPAPLAAAFRAGRSIGGFGAPANGGKREEYAGTLHPGRAIRYCGAVFGLPQPWGPGHDPRPWLRR